ncbi:MULTISPECIES: helix-turn-helix domain-containing protein [Glycomyces]|uniref:Helix-turn-helix domain-containing protein n=2 Tax=Glycomyces TaxID=58113 RepID=A0A9X3SUN2_9ACTN|nr:helix-turn-helix domain-containing protein [Glycomyces lechevalierae]MDA1383807.1 helix-turn-helix domain-containing protein [Glycomyces lechevalierae]MDR7341200.1 hypothetical protein [Glycomyces lechevalierae]
MTLQLNAQGGAMPGGRLTYEERGRIAAGLAQGLGHAEIARRLGRPASTVSREVARNGGDRRYRANLAQQAAQWRSRRRPAPPRPETPADDLPELHEFEERFTRTMIATGVPAMPARVLTCLYTSAAGSLTPTDLVAALHVSPASVSKAAAWLADRGFLWRETEGRRLRYRLDDQAFYHAWRASIAGMDAWADLTRQGADLLGDDTPAGARLRDSSRFFAYLRRDMADAAEHWRRITGSGGAQDAPRET